MKKCCKESKQKEVSLKQQQKGRLNGLVTSGVGDIQGEIEGRKELMGRRGRRCKQLMEIE